MWLDHPIAKSNDGKYHINAADWNERTNGGRSDYCGRFMNYHGDHPELEGKRTAFDTIFTCKPYTGLLIEGPHFVIEQEI